MANMLFANNANTTLASSLSAGATSMSVTSASAFPSPTGVQYFYCTLADAATQTTIEIVKVTSVSGTTFAITRAQDGTSATAFAAGAVVSLRLVRASLNDFPKLDETNTFNADQAISGQLTSSAGLATTGTFTATAPSDGLVMDYATGFGRFSAFAGDGFQWYNAGIANTKLMQLSSSGVITTATWNGATVGVGYGGTGLTAVTAGYIPFGSTSSALSTDSNLFWDATNHRLGIGTTSPAAALDVYGDGAFLTQRNATSAGGYGGLWAMDYAFFSGPSYKGVGIEQYGSTATGTTCGIANANLGQLIFQNNAGGLIYTNQNVPLYFGTSGTERMRLDSSGNLLIGTTSTLGSVNNNTQIVGGIFSTSSASGISALNATPTTLVTLPNISAGCWLISATLPGQGATAAYSCVAIVTTQGTTSSITTIKTATLASLSLSGLAVQITQVSGGTQGNCAYTAIRLY